MSDPVSIIDQYINKPMLVTPGYLAIACRIIAANSPATLPDAFRANAEAETGDRATGSISDDADNIAVIPVRGPLSQRQIFFSRGYNGIQHDVEQALADTSVKGILLDFATPGGMVSGCFDCSQFIAKANEVKPIWGLSNEYSFSAGYALMSATGRRIMPQSAEVGSVGVVMAHVSFEKALGDMGIDVTYIYAGDHKVDGNPTEKLPDGVRADLQRQVNYSYNQFTELVANNLGMQQKDVVATQARTYNADDAVTMGLADAVLSADDTVAEFRDHLKGASRITSIGGKSMTTDVNKPDEGSADKGVTDVTDKQTEATTASLAAAEEKGRQEGIAAGAEAERNRIFGIMGCDEAKGREATAFSFAKSGLTQEQARSALATVAIAPAADNGPSLLDKAMQQLGHTNADVNANLGTDANGNSIQLTDDQIAQQSADLLAASTANATGGVPAIENANAGGVPRV